MTPWRLPYVDSWGFGGSAWSFGGLGVWGSGGLGSGGLRVVWGLGLFGGLGVWETLGIPPSKALLPAIVGESPERGYEAHLAIAEIVTSYNPALEHRKTTETHTHTHTHACLTNFRLPRTYQDHRCTSDPIIPYRRSLMLGAARDTR